MLYLSLVFSYQIMAQCWQENPNDRPTFPSLKDIITRMSKNKNVSEKLRFSMAEVVNYWVALSFKCICFESLCEFFQRLTKLHEPVGFVQFVVSEKIYRCLFIQNCTRKIM